MNTKQRKDEAMRVFSHRLKEAFDAVINRQRVSGVDQCKMSEQRDTFVENLRDRQTRRHLWDHLTSSSNATFIEIRLQAEKMEDGDSDIDGEGEGGLGGGGGERESCSLTPGHRVVLRREQ